MNRSGKKINWKFDRQAARFKFGYKETFSGGRKILLDSGRSAIRRYKCSNPRCSAAITAWVRSVTPNLSRITLT